MASGRKPSNMTIGTAQPQPARSSQPEALPEIDFKSLAQSIHPEVRESAFFKDRYEGRLNALDELEKGNRLSEYGLKQLDHAFDLTEYSRVNPKTSAERELLNQSRHQLRDAIAHNDFLRVLREPEQDMAGSTFRYKGFNIPKPFGPALMREEHEQLLKNDRWMTRGEVSQTLEQLQEKIPEQRYTLHGHVRKEQKPDPRKLNQIHERNEQIIRESKNLGDDRAVDYFKNTANKSTGPYSTNPPLYYSGKPDAIRDALHGLFGGGQDRWITVDSIDGINDKRVIREQLGSLSEMQGALERLKKTGKPQRINIDTFEFQTGLMQSAGLGKVKLRADGYVQYAPDGKPIFMGSLEQGDNMEVYTFPKGERDFLKESLTTFGRESVPFTMFRTVIKGKKPVFFEFDAD